jgi:drug/metabolite transporter (DMT)-like permease
VIGLAYIFRGETMTPLQLAGAAIVIGSGFLFSWDFMRGRFKLAIFGLLTVSSMLWAGYQFSLSEAGRFADPWEAAACYYVATSVLGFLLFAVCRETRTVIIDTFHATRGQAVKLSLITNALDILALTTFLAALHQAPTIGHVAAVSGLQPIFSFFLAWPLAKVFPQHFSRPAMNRESFYKLALIGLICIGIYFLAAVP